MRNKRSLPAKPPREWALALVLALTLICLTPARAQEKACLECHDDVAKKLVTHKSCTGCHVGQTSPTPPHSPAGKSAREMAAAGSQMCVGCHDKKLFQGKTVHGPVATGQCLLCHASHTSTEVAHLRMEPVALCADCHPDVLKRGHRLSQFAAAGHPRGSGNTKIADPSRPGKTFYCASCHEPHRSDRPMLTRFGTGMDSCLKCHEI